MNNQDLMNLALGVISGGVGWWVKTIWGAVEVLKSRVAQTELVVASKCVTREELTQIVTKMFDKLDRIEDKLDKKVDK